MGGHVEKGETAEEAIVREVKEETCLKLNSYKKVANIFFDFAGTTEMMHVFISDDFQGRIKTDCPEGELQWLNKDQILNKIPIWEGDKYFLKKIFNNEPFFEMNMKYNGDKLIEHQLIERR